MPDKLQNNSLFYLELTNEILFCYLSHIVYSTQEVCKVVNKVFSFVAKNFIRTPGYFFKLADWETIKSWKEDKKAFLKQL